MKAEKASGRAKDDDNKKNSDGDSDSDRGGDSNRESEWRGGNNET